MHNCKTTQSELIDLVLAEVQTSAGAFETAVEQGKLERLRTALAICSDCRAEYASLRRTLGTFEQTVRAAVPGEAFWPGYHSRLVARLNNAAATNLTVPLKDRPSLQVWSQLKAFSRASVRIPVPVAAVILLLFGIATFALLTTRGSQQPEHSSAAVTVVTKTIEVPLIKEKFVTRVVYVTRNRKHSPAAGGNTASDSSAATARLAPEPAKTVFNLADFKPTDHLKLTIIKGSYHDEK
jgi:hypothetical protein